MYSPHTTFDAVNGGVNDWLLIPFGKFVKNISMGVRNYQYEINFLVPLQLSYSSYLCRKLGPGESKPLQEVDTGVGPGRLVVLNQPILLNDAIEKLKNHLKLPHLRLAVGVSVDRGKTFMLIRKYWLK